MSKQKTENKETLVEEVTVAAAEETPAEAAPETAPVTEETTPAAETTDEAPAENEETTEAAADTEEKTETEESAEEDTADDEELSEEDKNLFALVMKLVKKLKAKYAKGEKTDSDHVSVETDEDSDESNTIVSIESDEVILDDDIIAELKEQERKDKLKKQIALGAVGFAAAAVTLTLIVKAAKKKKD